MSQEPSAEAAALAKQLDIVATTMPRYELIAAMADRLDAFAASAVAAERAKHEHQADLIERYGADLQPMRAALRQAGIAAPPSDEHLAFHWVEHAQMLIRYVAALAERAKPAASDHEKAEWLVAQVQQLTAEGAYLESIADEIAAALTEARREVNEDWQRSFDYLGYLLKTLYPQIELLPTVAGRCTQIDNAIVGIRDEARREGGSAMRERAAKLCRDYCGAWIDQALGHERDDDYTVSERYRDYGQVAAELADKIAALPTTPDGTITK